MPLFAALEALRAEPASVAGLNRFLLAAYPVLRRLAQRYRDLEPDDVTQEAATQLRLGWARCRATCQGELVGWLRRVVFSRAMDALRRQRDQVPLDERLKLPAPAPGPHPDGVLQQAVDRARAHARQGAWSLTPPLRARAATHEVAARPVLRARDVDVLWALRHDGRPGAEVAQAFGMSRSAVYKSAARGAAAIGIAAALLARDEPDPFLRSALLEVAERGAPAGGRRAA